MYYVKCADLYHYTVNRYGRFGSIEKAHAYCAEHANDLQLALAGAGAPTDLEEAPQTHCAVCGQVQEKMNDKAT